MVLSNDQRVFKNKTFQNNPHNIEKLKTNITNLITGVKRVNLKKVARNVLKSELLR